MHERFPPAVKEHNYSVWEATLGVTNAAMHQKFKVATNAKSSADLKALGALTNSLPINEVDEEGRLITKEGDAEENDDAVQMCVTAAPTKIRDFYMMVSLGDVDVVPHIQESMHAVKDFDYTAFSLKAYANQPIVVADVFTDGKKRAERVAPKGGKGKAKMAVGKAKVAGDAKNTDPVVTAFHNKGEVGADASRTGMARLLLKLKAHDAENKAWSKLALDGNDKLYFDAMDLIESGQGGLLPEWFCDNKSSANFAKLAHFRTKKMGNTPPAWTHVQFNSATEKWTLLVSGNKAVQALRLDADDDEDEEVQLPHKRSRAQTSRAAPKKSLEEKNGREGKNGKDGDTEVQKTLDNMQSNLNELKEQNTAVQAALQQRPDPASNEQVAELKVKLDVALTGLNHLVQHFYDSHEMNSFCMRGMVNILRTKFDQTEIATVLKKTDMNDYLP